MRVVEDQLSLESMNPVRCQVASLPYFLCVAKKSQIASVALMSLVVMPENEMALLLML